MLAELFAVGTVGFYALMFLAFVIATIFEEYENGFLATMTVVSTVIALQSGYHLHVVQFLPKHPLETLGFFGVYLVAAVFVALAKWKYFVRFHVTRYNLEKRDIMERVDATEFTPQIARDLYERLQNLYGKSKVVINPQAADYKSNIVRWMTYWPCVALGAVIRNPVRRGFNALFAAVKGLFQNISDSAFKDIKEELAMRSINAPTFKTSKR